MRKLLFTLIICLLTTSVNAASVTLTKTYSVNDSVTASNLNGNNNAILGAVNGGLDNDNADTSNGYRFIEVKGSLPSVGTQGKVVYLTTNDTLYFDDGSAFVPVVTVTSTPANGDIIYYNSGWVQLTKGTAKQVLQMNAVATLPAWTSDVSADNLVLTETASFTTGANQGAIYTKNDGTQTEAFYRTESAGLEAQLTKGGRAKPIVGTPSNPTINTSTLATTDGLLVFTGGVGAGVSNSGVSIKTDSANPPTTVIARDSGDNNGASGENHSVSVLIKKGDYFIATRIGTLSSSTITFIPLD